MAVQTLNTGDCTLSMHGYARLNGYWIVITTSGLSQFLTFDESLRIIFCHKHWKNPRKLEPSKFYGYTVIFLTSKANPLLIQRSYNSSLIMIVVKVLGKGNVCKPNQYIIIRSWLQTRLALT